MPRRATTKPVLQISTNTAGIARSQTLARSAWVDGVIALPYEARSSREREAARSSRAGSNLWQRLAQVVHHRPDRQHRGDVDQHRAPQAGVDQTEEFAVIEQERNRHHLRH